MLQANSNANARNLALQNNRKYLREREERGERGKTPEEPEDPLKDATTLYVGNLFVKKRL
jgi:hypothetical protein